MLLIFGSAALGALLQEGIWWFNRRRILTPEKYHQLIGSPQIYFLTVLGFCVLTGGVALVWFSDGAAGPKEWLVFGAFMPAIIKQAAPGDVRTLGDDEQPMSPHHLPTIKQFWRAYVG